MPQAVLSQEALNSKVMRWVTGEPLLVPLITALAVSLIVVWIGLLSS